MLVCLEPRIYNTSTYIVLPTLLGPRKKIECHDFVPLVNLSSLVPLPSHQTYEAALAQRVRKSARKQKNRDEVMQARRRAAASSMLPEDVGDDFDGQPCCHEEPWPVKYRKRDEAYICTTSPVCAVVVVVCGCAQWFGVPVAVVQQPACTSAQEVREEAQGAARTGSRDA